MDTLAKTLQEDIVYPAAMLHVDRGILGAGFYPGAKGCTTDSFPYRGVMLLGRDFGTFDYYRSLSGHPVRSERCATWTRVKLHYLKALYSFPVFLTNYLMGVRLQAPATANIQDRLTDEEWKAYESSCWTFLEKQIEYVQPRAIIVLGTFNKEDLNKPERLGSTYRAVPVRYMRHPYSLIRKSVCNEHALELDSFIATLTS